jgi:hypothetical protein
MFFSSHNVADILILSSNTGRIVNGVLEQIDFDLCHCSNQEYCLKSRENSRKTCHNDLPVGL